MASHITGRSSQATERSTSTSYFPLQPDTPLSYSSRSPFGSLTTTFTPPPACSTFDTRGFNGRTCVNGTAKWNPACWPPMTVLSTASSMESAGFYRPGLIYPVGYTTACSSAANGFNSGTESLGSVTPSAFNFLSRKATRPPSAAVRLASLALGPLTRPLKVSSASIQPRGLPIR